MRTTEALLGVVSPPAVAGHMRFVGAVTYCPVVGARVPIFGSDLTECSACGAHVRPWQPAP